MRFLTSSAVTYNLISHIAMYRRTKSVPGVVRCVLFYISDNPYNGWWIYIPGAEWSYHHHFVLISFLVSVFNYRFLHLDAGWVALGVVVAALVHNSWERQGYPSPAGVTDIFCMELCAPFVFINWILYFPIIFNPYPPQGISTPLKESSTVEPILESWGFQVL